MTNSMKIFSIVLLTIISYSYMNAQDSIGVKVPQQRIGIGIEGAGVTSGPYIMYYNNYWIFSFAYGLPNSSTSNNTIKIYDRTYYLQIAHAFGYIKNDISYWPIYLGTGYTFVSEKNRVLNYIDNGSITSLSLYIGSMLLQGNNGIFKHLGVHLELGYSFWNYSNSVLKKNLSEKEYNYSKFYFSVGAFYYIM